MNLSSLSFIFNQSRLFIFWIVTLEHTSYYWGSTSWVPNKHKEYLYGFSWFCIRYVASGVRVSLPLISDGSPTHYSCDEAKLNVQHQTDISLSEIMQSMTDGSKPEMTWATWHWVLPEGRRGEKRRKGHWEWLIEISWMDMDEEDANCSGD